MWLDQCVKSGSPEAGMLRWGFTCKWLSKAGWLGKKVRKCRREAVREHWGSPAKMWPQAWVPQLDELQPAPIDKPWPKLHLRDFPATEVRKWEGRKLGIHTLWPDSHCPTASRDQRSQLAGASAFGIWRHVSPSGGRAVLWRGATARESAWQGTLQGLREKRKGIPGVAAEPQHGPWNPGCSLQRLARKSGD